ncbi:MAG: ParB N-terminal domain-containing protein [Ruminococcus sp.]|nr:ParB N-terminal domain-containing protein [Ruminococcus sp.]
MLDIIPDDFELDSFISNNNQVKLIPIDSLEPYHNHKFKLYTGERLEDMIESIRKNGILNPILVQPILNGKYEILSGHNRVECAKKVGLKEIPSIIKENLSEDEAEVYVIETNLMQRGFNDLLISEQAHVLKVQHSKMFSQGKRNDIIKELERLEGKTTSDAERPKLNGDSFTLDTITTSDAERPKLNGDSLTLDTITTSDAERPKLNSDSLTLDTITTSDAKRPKLTRDALAKDYGLGTTSVSYLIRINYLIQPIKDMIDNKTIPLKAGVELSFIPENIQSMVFKIVSKNNIKINIKMAKNIRQLCKDNSVPTETMLTNVLLNVNKQSTVKWVNVSLDKNIFSKYFTDKTSTEKINDILKKSLELYFSNNH